MSAQSTPISTSAPTAQPVGRRVGDIDWRPLRYLNVYRSVLSGLFTVLALTGSAPRPVGQAGAELFTATVVLYFLFSIGCSFTIRRRWPSFPIQLMAQVFGDILAITVMMHASGGVNSGFGMLLVVAVAGGSLLTEGRIAFLFAALASIAVLAQQVYTFLYMAFPVTNYAQAGLLGVAFFATALLAFYSARKVRESEALAARREVDLANLAQLNEYIIQRMQAGIIALDTQGVIRLVNESARGLLGFSGDAGGRHANWVVPELTELLGQWRGDRSRSTYIFRPSGSGLEVMASFAPMGRDAEDGVLVFLDDASSTRQRAQQLKLASLGRLTASIAHEIRNPLAAIRHAGQLLTETPTLSSGDLRLTDIIEDNCQRMNAIVENVLMLSRRREAVIENFTIAPWLERFVMDFCRETGLSREQIRATVTPKDLMIRMDLTQLHQVLRNLCENGVRHGGLEPLLEINVGLIEETDRPFLEVIDSGTGIDGEVAEQLFEPFFTTVAEGTGLGLYIARELCEINRASLNLISREGQGAHFRIIFSDPRRQGALS